MTIKSEIEWIPRVCWWCPICKEEEALIVDREKTGFFSSKWIVRCSSCGAKWDNVSEYAMTLIEGPEDLLGRKSMNEWAKISQRKIKIDVNPNIRTSVLLKKKEKPVKIGHVTLYQEKSGRVRTGGGSYGGISIPIIRTPVGAVRAHTGSLRSPVAYEEIAQIKKIDQGEFLITNRRIVFTGCQKTVTMDLKKIISIAVRHTDAVTIHYGQKVYLFNFGNESPYKWETYVRLIHKSMDKLV